MSENTLTITDNRTGSAYTLPITDGAIRAMDLRQIRDKKFLTTWTMRKSRRCWQMILPTSFSAGDRMSLFNAMWGRSA